MTGARTPTRRDRIRAARPLSVGDLAGLARAGEEAGYGPSSCRRWCPRHPGGPDGPGGRDRSAPAGDRRRALPARSPALLAMAAATVQERLGWAAPARGRDRSRGSRSADEARFDGRGPTPRVRRRRGAVDGAAVATDLQLEKPPQIWIAALGPKATRLAGAIADGVILNWCTPERVAVAAAELAEGAEGAGRDPAAVTIAVYVRAALAPGTQEAARRGGRGLRDVSGVSPPVRRSRDRPAEPDDVGRAGSSSPTPRAARDRLDAYRGAGAHLPVVYPVVPSGAPDAASARLTLDLLAPT